MIDLVAVEHQRALPLPDLQGGGLAAAAAAGDADDRHGVRQGVGDLLRGEGPLPQHAIGRRASYRDRRFPPRPQGPAVQHGGDFSVKIALDLLGCLGARLPGGIGRGRGKGDLRLFQKRQRQRVIRAAQADGLAAREDDGGDLSLAFSTMVNGPGQKRSARA